jgi:hypothetical protein
MSNALIFDIGHFDFYWELGIGNWELEILYFFLCKKNDA